MAYSKNDQDELIQFTQNDLTATLSKIEATISGLCQSDCDAFLDGVHATPNALSTAYEIKKLAGQINVTIHALGILACLPHILLDGEHVDYVSLGAGNTGRKFDLETNFRIAEFKFIHWRGGAESIRQNSIFKDFFELQQEETPKDKFLYLLGTEHALKFFNGGRALASVLSRSEVTKARFSELHGEKYMTVRQYFEAHKDSVVIEDVGRWVPQLLV